MTECGHLKGRNKDMEFLFVLFICPIVVLLATRLSVKQWFVMPIVTFIVFTILTVTVFNATFFIWAVMYSLLSLTVSLTMKFKRRNVNV